MQDKQKEPWLLSLYVCVAVVNTGYFLLSIAGTLSFAILANDIAYLGSVFLSVSMLLTIVRLSSLPTIHLHFTKIKEDVIK